MNTYNKWENTSMLHAISYVKSGHSFHESSILFKVPITTLRRRVRSGIDYQTNNIKNKSGSSATLKNLEIELKNYCLYMADRLLGLSCTEIMRAAYYIAEKNNIHHHFNKETNMAGRDWLMRFRSRFPELTLRTPEQTSGNTCCKIL